MKIDENMNSIIKTKASIMGLYVIKKWHGSLGCALWRWVSPSLINPNLREDENIYFLWVKLSPLFHLSLQWLNVKLWPTLPTESWNVPQILGATHGTQSARLTVWKGTGELELRIYSAPHPASGTMRYHRAEVEFFWNEIHHILFINQGLKWPSHLY